MSGGGGAQSAAGAGREYRCATEGCAGVVAVSALRQGVADVCCPVCGKVQRVYFGGYNPHHAGRVRVADPRNPPVEDGPVRPWRR